MVLPCFRCRMFKTFIVNLPYGYVSKLRPLNLPKTLNFRRNLVDLAKFYFWDISIKHLKMILPTEFNLQKKAVCHASSTSSYQSNSDSNAAKRLEKFNHPSTGRIECFQHHLQHCQPFEWSLRLADWSSWLAPFTSIYPRWSGSPTQTNYEPLRTPYITSLGSTKSTQHVRPKHSRPAGSRTSTKAPCFRQQKRKNTYSSHGPKKKLEYELSLQ